MPSNIEEYFLPLNLDRNSILENQSSVADQNEILGKLSTTNQAFFKELKPTLDVAKKTKLLNYIVWGREAEAKAMLEADPTLLLERAGVTSEVDREYRNVTAYELALYCGDTQMCRMMHAFFDKLNDGENARLKQYHNVIPDGFETVLGVQAAYNFDALIDAIDNASDAHVRAQLDDKATNTELGEIINAFREEFAAISKQELHANLKHLLEAFRVYTQDPRIAQWEQQENCSRNDIFWCQVIGYVQLYLPECDKQVFHQGLNEVVENNERLSREMDFKYYQGRSLHRMSDSSGCGFDFAAVGHGSQSPTLSPHVTLWCGMLWLKTYVERKKQTCRTYAATSASHNPAPHK